MLREGDPILFNWNTSKSVILTALFRHLRLIGGAEVEGAASAAVEELRHLGSQRGPYSNFPRDLYLHRYGDLTRIHIPSANYAFTTTMLSLLTPITDALDNYEMSLEISGQTYEQLQLARRSNVSRLLRAQFRVPRDGSAGRFMAIRTHN
nr:Unknown Function [uncultured bacterium]